jgi:molybdenum cofactor cytidylyltransferase
MIPFEATAAVLLCAGLSRRFGDPNKLLEPLAGEPLVNHAASLLASLPFGQQIAVVGHQDMPMLPPILKRIRNPEPEAGKDGSIRIGIDAALRGQPRGILICLGDMPHVTREHLAALAAAADDETAAISSAGEWCSPPLLLPARLAAAALEQPEKPIHDLLGEWPVTEVPALLELLLDFDVPDDFARG